MKKLILPILVFVLIGLVGFVSAESINTLEEYRASIDYSCQVDSDCMVKDVGDCCIHYSCVNKDMIINKSLGIALCSAKLGAVLCAEPTTLNSCACLDNKCEVSGPSCPNIQIMCVEGSRVEYENDSNRCRIPKCVKEGCENYYWFDNDNKDCDRKQFCGAYMYQGLRTFETKGECESVLRKGNYAPGEILIMFKSGTTKEMIEQLISTYNLTLKFEDLHRLSPNWFGTLNVPNGQEQNWINILKKENIVQAVELNYLSELMDNSNKECSQDSDCIRDECQSNKCVNIRDVWQTVVPCPPVKNSLSDSCICENNNKCIGYKNLSNGRKAEIKIMPETASQRAIERLGELGFNVSLKEVGSGDNAKVVYELKAKKEAKLFGFMKKEANVSVEVDAETGEVLKVKKPWWSFLASGI